MYIPWRCDDEDCPAQWHMEAIEADETAIGEWLWDSHCDGDWQPCDAEDVPSPEEARLAWKSYIEYVAETGDDPLGNFNVPVQFKRLTRWQVRFKRWIGSKDKGLIVTARRNGKGPWSRGRDLPQFVQEYLCIDESHSPDGYLIATDLAGLHSIAQTSDALTIQPKKCNSMTVQGWVTIGEYVDRQENAIRNERRGLARDALVDYPNAVFIEEFA